MFNQKQLGRIQHDGKTYYGKPQFFKNNMVTLKPEYSNWVEDYNKKPSGGTDGLKFIGRSRSSTG